MSKSSNHAEDTLQHNLQLLQTFWNRHTFHDMGVDAPQRIQGRVIIPLDSYILVLLNVTNYREQVEEYPTAWLYDDLQTNNNTATLNVELELGLLTVRFGNFRLLERNTMRILIPAIDP